MPRRVAELTFLLAATTPDPATRDAFRTWATQLRGPAAEQLAAALTLNPHVVGAELDALARPGRRSGPKRSLVTGLVTRPDVTADHIAAWWPDERRPQVLADIVRLVPGIDAYVADRGAAVDNTTLDAAIIGSLHTSFATRVAAGARTLARREQLPATKLRAVMALAHADLDVEARFREAASGETWARVQDIAPCPPPRPTLPFAAELRRLTKGNVRLVVLGWLRAAPRTVAEVLTVARSNATAAAAIITHHPDPSDALVHGILEAYPTDADLLSTVASAPGLTETGRRAALLAAIDAQTRQYPNGGTPPALDQQWHQKPTLLDRYAGDATFANTFAGLAATAGTSVAALVRGWDSLTPDTLRRLLDRWEQTEPRSGHPGITDILLLRRDLDPQLRDRALRAAAAAADRAWEAASPYTRSLRGGNRDVSRMNVLARVAVDDLAGADVADVEAYLGMALSNPGRRSSYAAPLGSVLGPAVHGGDPTRLHDPGTLATLDDVAQQRVGTIGDLLSLTAALAL